MGELIELANIKQPIIDGINAQLAEIANRTISLDDPKYGVKGDGTDETTKIRQAFADAMTSGVAIDLGKATTKYTITQSIVIDKPLTIYANGANSIFEQLSWCVPCIEIRNPNVTIIGAFHFECNQPRVFVDSTVFNAAPNNALVKAENPVFYTGAGAAVYCMHDFDHMYIDKVYAKGFIGGIYAAGRNTDLTRDIHINCLTIENVDFGFLGVCFQDIYIGEINGKNILRSQGVDVHALYFTQSSIRSKGGYIGSVTCDGIEDLESHVVSIKTFDDIHIGRIFGQNVGTFFTTISSSGYVGSIEGTAKAGDNYFGGVNIQDNCDYVINSIDISSNAAYQSPTVVGRAVTVVGGANAVINKARIKMTSASPSEAFMLSGSGRIIINNPIIEYVNPQMSAELMYAIRILFSGGTGLKGIYVNDPELIGGSYLLRKAAGGAVYELVFDPNKVRGGIVESTVLCEDAVFNNTFTSFSKTAFNATTLDTQPSIGSRNVLKTSRGAANTILKFRAGTNGQEFILIQNDTVTSIAHNTDIILKGGATLSPTSWKLLRFVWFDGKAYEI